MMNPFLIIVSAARRAFDVYYHAVALSAVWVFAQFLIIPGPPATAMLFAMARDTHDGYRWNAGSVARAFRELFVPGWLWALPNVPAAVALAWLPFSAAWGGGGAAAVAARVGWVALAVAWLGVNLFYWPAWLAAERPGVRRGYAGSLRFWRRRPVVGLYVLLVCGLVALLCLPFVVPLILGVAFWVALSAETAFRRTKRRDGATDYTDF